MPSSQDAATNAGPQDQPYSLLASEANQAREMRVYERKPRAGSPVAKQPRLDVINPERPFQQRIVLEVDLPNRQVVARAPPSVNGSQLAIGESSKFVSGQFQGHTASLVRLGASSEGRRSLVRTARSYLADRPRHRWPIDLLSLFTVRLG